MGWNTLKPAPPQAIAVVTWASLAPAQTAPPGQAALSGLGMGHGSVSGWVGMVTRSLRVRKRPSKRTGKGSPDSGTAKDPGRWA